MHASEAKRSVVTRCHKGLVQVNTPEPSVASFTNLVERRGLEAVGLCGNCNCVVVKPSATYPC